MENRSNEFAFQVAAPARRGLIDDSGDAPLSGDELHLLIEFFRLLDGWDRLEVVQ